MAVRLVLSRSTSAAISSGAHGLCPARATPPTAPADSGNPLLVEPLATAHVSTSGPPRQRAYLSGSASSMAGPGTAPGPGSQPPPGTSPSGVHAASSPRRRAIRDSHGIQNCPDLRPTRRLLVLNVGARASVSTPSSQTVVVELSPAGGTSGRGKSSRSASDPRPAYRRASRAPHLPVHRYIASPRPPSKPALAAAGPRPSTHQTSEEPDRLRHPGEAERLLAGAHPRRPHSACPACRRRLPCVARLHGRTSASSPSWGISSTATACLVAGPLHPRCTSSPAGAVALHRHSNDCICAARRGGSFAPGGQTEPLHPRAISLAGR